jgi:hypothetical protein
MLQGQGGPQGGEPEIEEIVVSRIPLFVWFTSSRESAFSEMEPAKKEQ